MLRSSDRDFYEILIIEDWWFDNFDHFDYTLDVLNSSVEEQWSV